MSNSATRGLAAALLVTSGLAAMTSDAFAQKIEEIVVTTE